MKITQWPDADHKNLVGEVIDVLGPAGDNDVEMNTILAQYGLPYKYPKRVEDAADKITGEVTKRRSRREGGLQRHMDVHHRPERRQGL